MSLIFKQYTEDDAFSKLERQWNILLNAKQSGHFFLGADWLSLWWQHYRPTNANLLILAWYDCLNNLVALAPLYQQGTNIMFLGTGGDSHDEVATEYLDVLYEPEFKPYIQRDITRFFKQKLALGNQLNVVNYLENSFIANTLDKLIHVSWQRHQMCGSRYYIDLPSTFGEFRKKLSKSFDKRMHSYQKRLFNSLNGTIDKVTQPEQLNNYFHAMARLHNKHWQARGKNGAFSSERFTKFHLAFCKKKWEQNQLQLWLLKSGESLIAALYAIDHNQCRYFYQSGIDTEFRPNVAPGNVIHLLAIEDAINHNLRHYDFMKGTNTHSYKQKFATQKTAMLNNIIIKKSLGNFPTMIKWKIKHLVRIIRQW